MSKDSKISLSFVLTHYENPKTLQLQIRNFGSFAPDLRSAIELILVDDGSQRSPIHPEAAIFDGLNVVVARVVEDKPWNHFAARNIGAHLASGFMVFLHDMDILIPESTAAFALGVAQTLTTENTIYYFPRFSYFDRSRRSIHHDTILMKKETYWKTGGYDEDFQGIYGAGPRFSKELKKNYRTSIAEEHYVWSLSQDIMPDAATQSLSRTLGPKNRARLWALVFAKSLRLTRRVSALRCPYELVWSWRGLK